MPKRITLHLGKRSDGRFCKRIDGHLFIWPDEKTAHAAVVELIRRRSVGGNGAPSTVPIVSAEPPLRVLANWFRDAKKPKVSPKTLDEYEYAIDGFFEHVDKLRLASSLTPEDFRVVREAWDNLLGPFKLGVRLQAIRSMFRWAHEKARLIAEVPWYGDEFSNPSEQEKRAAIRAGIEERGERKFTPPELRKILANATGQIRAFVLLALNGGMYSSEIAALAPNDLKRHGRTWYIDNDRPKTGERRTFVLWPETVAAINESRTTILETRLFATRFGNPWVSGKTDSIALAFRAFLKRLKIYRRGVGFGSFRPTHTSLVGGHADRNAARRVRGHRIEGIEVHYDFPDLARLKRVTDLARRGLPPLTKSARPIASRPAPAQPVASRPSRRLRARRA